MEVTNKFYRRSEVEASIRRLISTKRTIMLVIGGSELEVKRTHYNLATATI